MKTTTKNVFLVLAITIFGFVAHAQDQAAPAAEKEWTFLLFLNGHNNLSSFGDMNIKDMEKVGSSDQVNMVVQWGSAATNLTHRLLVKKSTNPAKVTSPIIMSLKDNDMGNYKNLVEFVKWGAEKFPARHYFVAVWNHGSGWHFEQYGAGLLKSNPVHINDISFDDNSGNHITTEQLGLAMSEIKQVLGRNVDIYGSDACLMSMIEVAAEMKDSVNYFVGSEEVEPGEGWPYETFMKKWTATPNSTPAEVATSLSKEYLKAYNGGVYGRREVTFSALDLTKLDALISSSKQLAQHLRSLGKDSLLKIKNAMNTSVLDFYYSDYKDYGDFVKVVNALPIKKDDKLFAEVASDIKDVVLTVDSTSTFTKATGIAIWIPGYSSSYMDRYTGLEFDKQTGWSDFLKSALATQ